MNAVTVVQEWHRLRTLLRSRLLAPSFADFGLGTRVASGARLHGVERMELGRGVYVGPDSWLQTIGDGRLVVGDRVSLSARVTLSAVASVVVEDGALLAGGVYVADHDHAFDRSDLPVRDQGVANVAPVVIGAGSWLAQHVVVTSGVRIGRGTVVGANSVVTTDLPDRVVAVGAPARVVRELAGRPHLGEG